MSAPPDADDYYQRHIAPLAEEFEARRLVAIGEYRWRLRVGLWLTLAAVALSALVIYFTILASWGPGAFFALIVPAVVFGVIAYFWVNKPLTRYASAVREEVYPRIFGFFGDDFTYQRTCPWSAKSLKGSDIIPSFDNEDLEDYVKGTHNSVGFEMVEAKLTKSDHDEEGSSTRTVFKGVFLVLTTSGRFAGRTVVKRDSGRWGNAIRGFFKDTFQGLETVRLQSPEFEDKFEVYADDPREAHRQLSSRFMRGLLELGSTIGVDAFDCSFFDNKLLIRIPTDRAFFEPRSAKEPVNLRDDFLAVTHEIGVVFAVIDGLGLDH